MRRVEVQLSQHFALMCRTLNHQVRAADKFHDRSPIEELPQSSANTKSLTDRERNAPPLRNSLSEDRWLPDGEEPEGPYMLTLERGDMPDGLAGATTWSKVSISIAVGCWDYH